MTALLAALYGLLAFVGATNWLLMRRPRPLRPERWPFCVLVPCRNEAHNLPDLLPPLVQAGARVYVFDDESEDGTAEVARRLGATVLSAREPLPEGWVGKNRACDALAQAALEDAPEDWLLFLDADVKPGPGFLEAAAGCCAAMAGRRAVGTAFLRVAPGLGLQPLALAWVWWSLLATNPFGWVRLVRRGHNRFLNGQFVLWPSRLYAELTPHRRLRGAILEDVRIGRLLAAERVPVEVFLLGRWASVRMYSTWRETIEGMTKNAVEVAGPVGSWLLAAFLLLCGWAWVADPRWGLLGLAGSLAACRCARAPLWTVPLLPIGLSVGACTVVRSWVRRRRGAREWKGRVYG